ncbi:MAG: chromosomal replication initiator protein DnaA [Corynebacterium sp.]|uniref:chromosomal replication initiator protein DnaA n=1 Tax=Corynebacterium sp. TaxID=1720 RepID=UPI003F9D5F66
MSDDVDFPDFWASLLDRWVNADESSAEYPRLSPRSRSLLRQLTPVTLVSRIAVLTAPSKWVHTETESNLAHLISDVLESELGYRVTLSLTVEDHLSEPEPHSVGGGEQQEAPRQQPEPVPDRRRQHWEDLTGAGYQPRQAPEVVRPEPHTESRDSTENRLNPQYTFDTFVTGSSNQFANAACRAVAERPAQAYNPLFIWGESGLGKTHLLHAIGHYARDLRTGMNVRYISSEEMTNEFVNSVRDGRGEQFKRRYRNLDMLIVDDVQFLQGKESTQEEFFHTFNALQQANRQIVLSSDRPPWQLTTLEDRLRTRFEGGLITDVQTPDLETRMAILSKKAQMEGTYLPDDVLELIASRYEKSIRELEGAMIRVTAYCSLSKEPVTREAAEVALRDIMPDPQDVEITPQIIIEVITGYFNVTVEELVGKAKVRHLVTARQLSMYLCRELTELPLKEIGAVFGGRDHTTVIYAERKVRTTIQEDRKTFQQIQELTQRIKSRARQ